jgi:hypothetical protein
MRCMAAIVTNVCGRDRDTVALVAFGYWTGEEFFHDRIIRSLRPTTLRTGSGQESIATPRVDSASPNAG